MCLRPWTFNTAAYATLDTSYFSMMNTQMNLAYESLKTSSLLFQMPNPMWGGGYQLMNNFNFNLPDPKEWAQHVWDMRPEYLKNPQFFFNSNSVNNNTNTNITPTNPQEKEYQDIRGMLQKILNEKIFAANSEEEKAISEALTKTGTPEERLQAVKDALKKIASNPDVKSAIARIAMSDNDIKVALYDTGYNFDNGHYGVQNDFSDRNKYKSNVDLVANANTAVDELKSWPDEKSKGLATTVTMIGNDTTPNADIISNLSYLNRTTGEEGGFIKLLTSKWKETEGFKNCDNNGEQEQETWKKAMKGVYTSLRQKALGINKDTLGADLKTKFNKALDDLQNAFTVVSNGTVKDENINNYVNKFNNLYKMIRLIQAKKIDNEIASKYGYLNNTAEGIVPENVVVDETKTMLEDEKIGSTSDIDVSKVTGDMKGNVTTSSTGRGSSTSTNPAEAKAERLSSGYLTPETNIGEGVYSTKTSYSTSNPKTFYVVQDNKLIELNGAVRYMNGSFKMKDGSTKSLEDLIEANKNNADVDEATIKKTVNFKEKIDKYINNGKLEEADPTGSNGEAILSGTAGTITFTIIGHELFEIDRCDIDDLESASSIVFNNNKAKVGTKEYNLKKITDWNVIENL